jgi:hypothetical protein
MIVNYMLTIKIITLYVLQLKRASSKSQMYICAV